MSESELHFDKPNRQRLRAIALDEIVRAQVHKGVRKYLKSKLRYEESMRQFDSKWREQGRDAKSKLTRDEFDEKLKTLMEEWGTALERIERQHAPPRLQASVVDQLSMESVCLLIAKAALRISTAAFVPDEFRDLFEATNSTEDEYDTAGVAKSTDSGLQAWQAEVVRNCLLDCKTPEFEAIDLLIDRLLHELASKGLNGGQNLDGCGEDAACEGYAKPPETAQELSNDEILIRALTKRQWAVISHLRETSNQVRFSTLKRVEGAFGKGEETKDGSVESVFQRCRDALADVGLEVQLSTSADGERWAKLVDLKKRK